MTERFVSEPIQPVTATYDTARMAAGEPGLPRAFTWRGRTIEVAAVLRTCAKPANAATAAPNCMYASTGTRSPPAPTRP